MKADEITIEVSAKLQVSKSTAEGCLKLVEIYLNEHPNTKIIVNRNDDETENFYFEEMEIDKPNLPEPSDLSQNCWRPIDEYDETKYDWVLVRQADAFDKMLPTVAEKRKNGKWYDQHDDQLPYEVVEFFDMQLLNREEKKDVNTL